MKNLENLRSLIGAFDATGGYFAVHKGTLNDNGLALRDEMLAELKQAEAEHAALVAVAEAAVCFEPYANAQDSAPNGKAIMLSNLSAALEKLVAVRTESGVAK